MTVRRAQVAERAGVSPAVVSYVLNGGPRPVSATTRAAVLKAVEELNYRPNRIARSLRVNATMTLGLVVPDTANPYFAELAHAIEQAAFEAGYTLLVGNASEDQSRQTRYVQTFLQQQVDGLILVPAHGPVDCLTDLIGSDKAWLLLDRRVEEADEADHVLLDNRAGARAATEHLIAHGRRAIACIAGPSDVASAQDRAGGWRDALAAAGLDDGSERIWHVPYDKREGYDAAAAIFGAGDSPIDAVFVASDEQAVGVLRAFADLGVRCPEDVAVVSFDGIEAGAYTVPGLTTMAQPFAELGKASVARLVARISGADLPSDPELSLSLVVRGSCGCPPYTDRHLGTVAHHYNLEETS